MDEFQDYELTDEGYKATQPSPTEVNDRKVLESMEAGKAEAMKKGDFEEASKLSEAENALQLNRAYSKMIENYENGVYENEETKESSMPQTEDMAKLADETQTGLDVEVGNEWDLKKFTDMGKKLFPIADLATNKKVQETISTVGLMGYSYAYNAPKAVARLGDFISLPIREKMSDNPEEPFSFTKSYEKLAGTEDEFLDTIYQSVTGDPTAATANLTPYGDISKLGGKLLADAALVGGAIRGFNTMMGFKTGFYGTETAATAYEQAGHLSKIGKIPTKDLLNKMAISPLKAFGTGLARTGVGEATYIAAQFDKDYSTTLDVYAQSIKDNPKMSVGFLLGGTALEGYSILRGAKTALANVTREANKNFTAKMGSTLVDSFGHGDTIRNNSVAYVQNLEHGAKFQQVKQSITEASSKLLAEEKITAETFNNVTNELAQYGKLVDAAESNTLNKFTRNKGEQNVIKNFTKSRGNQILLAASNKIQSYSNVLKKAPERELQRISWLGIKKTEDAIKEKGFSRFVIAEDGSVRSSANFEPAFADRIKPGDVRKPSANTDNLLELNGIGKKANPIRVGSTPTYKEAESWSWVVKQNTDELAKMTNPKPSPKTGKTAAPKLKHEQDIRYMGEGAGKNPWMAQALAQLLEDKPAIGVQLGLKSPAEYRAMADQVIVGQVKKAMARGKDVVEEAAKYNINVTDRDKFVMDLMDNKIVRGENGSSTYGDFNVTDASARNKLVLTVDNDTLKELNQLDRMQEFGEVTNMQLQMSLLEAGSTNPALKGLTGILLDNPLVDEAKNMDNLVGDVLPKGLSSLLSKQFNATLDSTKLAINRLTDIMHQNMYKYMGDRLKPLKDMAGKFTESSTMELNKVKKLVNMGFELTDDFKIKTNDIADSGFQSLTARNRNAWQRAHELGLVDQSVDDMAEALRNAQGDFNDIVALPDLSGNKGKLALGQETMDFLTEYNGVNSELYNGKGSVRELFGAKAGWEQPFHMSNKQGKLVEFIYDESDNLVHTVTANSPEQLSKAVQKEKDLLKKTNPKGTYISKSKEMAKREHLVDPDEDWFGWTSSNGDYDRLQYNSGRQERTSVGAAMEYDPSITQTLYDDLIKSSRGLTQQYQGAFFSKEMQYAKLLMDDATGVGAEATRRNLGEYIGLLNGRSVNTSTTSSGFNKWVSDHTESLFNTLTDMKTAQVDKQVERTLKQSGELDKMNDFIVKLPSVGGVHVTQKLQAFTNWSLLRFGNLSASMMNILSLAPMSKLAVSGISKGADESFDLWKARTGLYGIGVDEANGLTNVDWVGAVTDTTRRMFHKDNKVMIEKAIEGGYLSRDAATLRDIVFNPVSVINDQKANSIIGKVGQGIKKSAKYVDRKVTSVYDTSEELSRTFSFSMGYNIAEKAGIKGDTTRFIFAKQFSDNVVGNYSALNKPNVYRGAVPSMLGTFKTYKLNVMQQLMDAYGRGDKKGLAGALGVQSAVFGANSLPFKEVLESAILPVTGEDDGYSRLNKLLNGNEGLTRSIMYGGASHLIDLDLSQRGDVDPLKGGFLPLSGSMNFTDLFPVARQVDDGINLTGEVSRMMMSETGYNSRKMNELVSQYAPFPAIKAAAKLGNRMTDYEGNDFLYQVTRANEINKISAASAVLGLQSINNAESYRIGARKKARDQIQGKLMDECRADTRTAIRATANGNIVIDVDPYVNSFKKFVEAGGDPTAYAEWFSTQISAATMDKLENQVKFSTKNTGPMKMQDFYDMQKYLGLATYEQTK